ncbi:MAG: NrsF family protein [Bauldia sp.]
MISALVADLRPLTLRRWSVRLSPLVGFIWLMAWVFGTVGHAGEAVVDDAIRLIVILIGTAAGLTAVSRLRAPAVVGRSLFGVIAPSVGVVGFAGIGLVLGAPSAPSAPTLAEQLDCVLLVQVVGLGPLTALLMPLRQAPSNYPVLVGAVAGILSGTLGTLACGLFGEASLGTLAITYPIGIAVSGTLGAIAGDRFLRW